MRIHTNTLTGPQIFAAELSAADVAVHVVGEYGSRTHVRAFEVVITGHGARHTRPAAHRGANGGKSATYDDWGHVLATLFECDPSMKAGPYANRADFHAQTDGRYVPKADDYMTLADDSGHTVEYLEDCGEDDVRVIRFDLVAGTRAGKPYLTSGRYLRNVRNVRRADPHDVIERF